MLKTLNKNRTYKKAIAMLVAFCVCLGNVVLLDTHALSLPGIEDTVEEHSESNEPFVVLEIHSLYGYTIDDLYKTLPDNTPAIDLEAIEQNLKNNGIGTFVDGEETFRKYWEFILANFKVVTDGTSYEKQRYDFFYDTFTPIMEDIGLLSNSEDTPLQYSSSTYEEYMPWENGIQGEQFSLGKIEGFDVRGEFIIPELADRGNENFIIRVDATIAPGAGNAAQVIEELVLGDDEGGTGKYYLLSDANFELLIANDSVPLGTNMYQKDPSSGAMIYAGTYTGVGGFSPETGKEYYRVIDYGTPYSGSAKPAPGAGEFYYYAENRGFATKEDVDAGLYEDVELTDYDFLIGEVFYDYVGEGLGQYVFVPDPSGELHKAATDHVFIDFGLENNDWFEKEILDTTPGTVDVEVNRVFVNDVTPEDIENADLIHFADGKYSGTYVGQDQWGYSRVYDVELSDASLIKLYDAKVTTPILISEDIDLYASSTANVEVFINTLVNELDAPSDRDLYGAVFSNVYMYKPLDTSLATFSTTFSEQINGSVAESDNLNAKIDSSLSDFFSDVHNTIYLENFNRISSGLDFELLPYTISMASSIRHIINDKIANNSQVKSNVSILEIKPDASDDSISASTVKNIWLPSEWTTSKYTVTSMGVNEFNSSIEDLVSTYDLIYIDRGNEEYTNIGESVGGHYLGGYDITEDKLVELSTFVQSGQALVVNERLLESGLPNDGEIDNSSNLYEFLSTYLTYPNAFSTEGLSLSSALGEFVGFAKPEIDLKSPAEYTGVSDMTVLGPDDKVKANNLNYRFTIDNSNELYPDQTEYYVNLYIDQNADGIFSDFEMMNDVIIYENTSSVLTPSTNGEIKAGVDYRIQKTLLSQFTGAIYWQVEVVKANQPNIKTIETGTTYVVAETKSAVNVLAISNGKSEFSDTLNTQLDMISHVYDVNINYMTVTELEAMTLEEFNLLVQGSEGSASDNQIDVILFGFEDAGTTYNLSSHVVSLLKVYTELRKPIIFGGDVITESNGSEVRDLFGMDRYGVTSGYSDPADLIANDYEVAYQLESNKGVVLNVEGYTDQSIDVSLENSSTQIEQVNTSQFTQYPFILPESMSISQSNIQPFQLNVEKDKLAVWYTLDTNDEYKRDGINNYFAFSNETVSYLGLTEKELSETEAQLLVNTIIAAYRRRVANVEIDLLSPDSGVTINSLVLPVSATVAADGSLITSSIEVAAIDEFSMNRRIDFVLNDPNFNGGQNLEVKVVVLGEDGFETVHEAKMYLSSDTDHENQLVNGTLENDQRYKLYLPDAILQEVADKGSITVRIRIITHSIDPDEHGNSYSGANIQVSLLGLLPTG